MVTQSRVLSNFSHWWEGDSVTVCCQSKGIDEVCHSDGDQKNGRGGNHPTSCWQKQKSVRHCHCRQQPHIPHGQRFLRYINKDQTRWEVNLGALYDTKYWYWRQTAVQDVQARVILAKEQVLYEKKIGWITSWNLSMQDCPRCPGCNHYEFLHESQAFLVCFAAQRLESLQ